MQGQGHVFGQAFRASGHQHLENFLSYNDADYWTKVMDASSTITVQDGGGVALLATASNEEASIGSTNKVLQINPSATLSAGTGTSDSIRLRFDVKVDRDADLEAGVFIGMSDTVADVVANGGTTPVTSADMIGFFLAKDGTTWSAVYSNGATQTIEADVADFTDNEVVHLEIQVGVRTGGIWVKWYVNGEEVHSVEGKTTTSMGPSFKEVASIKATSANDQTLYVYRKFAEQHYGSAHN